MTAGPSSTFLTTAQLVARWNNLFTATTLRGWRGKGQGPAWCQPGGPRGKVLYRLDAVQKYERENGMVPKE
jgi:hypothetical protein